MQKVRWLSILYHLGYITLVPFCMAIVTLAFAYFVGETNALIPFFVTAVLCALLWGVTHLTCECKRGPTLWDSMIIAAVSWFVAPCIAALPMYLMALQTAPESALYVLQDIPNALFESFSGFTSTGVTLVSKPSEFPLTVLFWRSLLQWVGGVGLVVFLLAILDRGKKQYHLYFAETRSDHLGVSISETTKVICYIYCGYTIIAFMLFVLSGMNTWESFNHALCGISTGGFTVNDSSFTHYSTASKVAGIIVMLLGAMSFAVHYKIVKERRAFLLVKDAQHLIFFLIIFISSMLVFFISNSTNDGWELVDSFFMVTSACSSCGFTSTSLSYQPVSLRLILMIGMLIGGAAGSTSGGIKVKRMMNIATSWNSRIMGITQLETKSVIKKHVQKLQEEEPAVRMPQTEKSQRLFASSVLFSMWIGFVFLGWILAVAFLPETKSVNAFFEVVSCMSNAGLNTNIVEPSMNIVTKITYIFLMWLGRLEVIPFFVLCASLFPRTTKYKN